MPVVAVSCGGFFTMTLTEEGQLWNWGGKGAMSIVRNYILLNYGKKLD